MKTITKATILVLIYVLTASPLFAQFSKKDWERINKFSYADHKLMMKWLGIKSIRRGPSGDPKAPDAATAFRV